MLELKQFTGTEHYYKHPFGYVYTDGIFYLLETAKCFWLADVVFSHIRTSKRLQAEEFLVCNLESDQKDGAIFTIDDGNGVILATQAISYTDFPFGALESEDKRLKLYFENDVLCLPSER